MLIFFCCGGKVVLLHSRWLVAGMTPALWYLLSSVLIGLSLWSLQVSVTTVQVFAVQCAAAFEKYFLLLLWSSSFWRSFNWLGNTHLMNVVLLTVSYQMFQVYVCSIDMIFFCWLCQKLLDMSCVKDFKTLLANLLVFKIVWQNGAGTRFLQSILWHTVGA